MKMDIETVASELKLDRSNWALTTFGEVAIQQKESVDRENTEITRYVKGEHMCSEDLHLREWGELKDEYLGPAFIRKFEEGDILYGSRRTYLRKVCIAPFTGITANTTFVIKANEDLIDKRLLPFVMLSKGFSEHSIRNSKGSVNPYVNWKDLANYEFLLPPKSQQGQLAKLLLEMDSATEAEIKLFKTLNTFLSSKIENEIHGVVLFGKTIDEVLDEASCEFELKPLSELGVVIKGSGIPKSDVVDVGIPCIRYGELYTKHHRIIREHHSFIPENLRQDSVLLEKGDVLFAGSGETITEIGKSASFVSNDEAYASGDILIFRPNEMDCYYLGYLMNSAIVRYQLNKFGTGATVMHIYRSDIEKILVPDLPIEEQERIGGLLEQISLNIYSIESTIKAMKTLQKDLINQVF